MNSPKAIRRQKILQAALKLFAGKGFQDVTIAEISKMAGVSEATVYEYFKTKEDLLFSIPEGKTEEYLKEFETVSPYLKGSEEKLRAIVRGYMTLYEKNPEYSALIMLQLKTSRNFLNTKAYGKVQKGAQMILGFIREGIEEGLYRKDVDPFLVRSMILGTIEHLCIRCHLLGKPVDLICHADSLLELILQGIRVSTKPNKLTFSLHFDDGGVCEEQEKPGKE